MEYQNNKKYKKNSKPNSQKVGKKQSKPQRSEKAKKGGRQGKQPISGFSTLSQVAGVPVKKTHHSTLDTPPVKSVQEPHPNCAYCGEPIDLIADSFSVEGGYAHFDCVLSSIKEREVLEENQTISYLGSGSFGICQKDENGKYSIIKKIEVENKDSGIAIREYIEGLKS